MVSSDLAKMIEFWKVSGPVVAEAITERSIADAKADPAKADKWAEARKVVDRAIEAADSVTVKSANGDGWATLREVFERAEEVVAELAAEADKL